MTTVRSAQARPGASDLAHWYRLWNAMLHVKGRWGSPRAWDVEELFDAARRRTGLSDFGQLDGDFRSALQIWLQAAAEEAALSPLGRLSVKAETTWLLCNRLLIQRELDRTPELIREPLPEPTFVIGLPRSGTTLLHRLLALHPGDRAPLTWELFEPVPLGKHRPDLRLLRARAKVAGALAIQPRLRSVHPLDPTGPEECVLTLQQTFQTSHFATTAHVPSYESWLDGQSLAPAYRYHRAVLAILQRAQPGRRWVLKAPVHLYGLPDLIDVFPNARIVHIHRDPLEACASGCDLTALLRGFYSDRVDRQTIGAEWVTTWATALDRARAAGRLLPARQICDVDYRDLVADPVGSIVRVRAHFGEIVSSEAQAAMRLWLQANPKDRYGRHTYHLDDFGITASQVLDRFEEYRAEFGLGSEDTSSRSVSKRLEAVVA